MTKFDLIFKGYMCIWGARYGIPFDIMADWFEAASETSNYYVNRLLNRA